MVIRDDPATSFGATLVRCKKDFDKDVNYVLVL
jgi:hypothetical protein